MQITNKENILLIAAKNALRSIAASRCCNKGPAHTDLLLLAYQTLEQAIAIVEEDSNKGDK